MESFEIGTTNAQELVDITGKVQAILNKAGADDGICTVFVPHTTAGVTINENADPAVKSDIIKGLGVIPGSGYSHSEGNSPAHIKSSLVGPSLQVIVVRGKLRLGTWQGIYFAEFDGPRRRSVWVEFSRRS